MLSERVVFILGAGSSYELGLPLGGKLKADIATKLDFDYKGRSSGAGDLAIFNALSGSTDIPVDELLHAASIISRAMPMAASIDNFLHTHSANNAVVRVGKMAICRCIVEAERASSIINVELDYGKAGCLTAMQRLLFSGLLASDVEHCFDNCSIINFNYDRVVERFMPLAVADYFDVDSVKAQQISQKLTVFHVYGSVGDLNSVPYGDPSALDWLKAIGNLRTFTEGVGGSTLQQELFNLLSGAEVLVFLGFRFIKINYDLITDAGLNDVRRVLATVYELQPGISEFLARQPPFNSPLSTRANTSCLGLLEGYERSITNPA